MTDQPTNRPTLLPIELLSQLKINKAWSLTLLNIIQRFCKFKSYRYTRSWLLLHFLGNKTVSNNFIIDFVPKVDLPSQLIKFKNSSYILFLRTGLSPAQLQLSFSFAELKLALFLINPVTHLPTHESSEQAKKCAAAVKFQLF